MIFLCLLATVPLNTQAAQPDTPVTVTIDRAPTVTPSPLEDVSAIAAFRIIVQSEERDAARLRVFAANAKSAPVSEGQIFDGVVKITGESIVTVTVPLLEVGDFYLRAIVFPVDAASGEWTKDAASRADLVYFRFDSEGAITAYDPIDYSQLSARERTESLPEFGLQDAHPGEKELPSALNSDYPTVSKDGLKLRAPRLVVGTGETVARVPEDHEVPAHVEEAIAEVEASAAASAVSGNPEYITLYGTVSTKINGITVPLHYTEVKVYDHDTLSPDDLLATVRTDNQGNYNVVVKNDDGPGGGGVDVYLYIHSQTSQADLLYLVPDGEGGYVPFYYTWQSSTHDNLDQRTVKIDYAINSDNLAATIWAGTSAATWLVKSTTGRDLSHVEVRYPPFESGTHARGNIINIDPSHGDSPDTVGHEYGHAVMYQAYGSQPDEAGGAHSLCETATKGLAWSEGFATWYGVAAWNEAATMSWHIGGNTVDIEKWHCGPKDAGTDEGRAAAWVWDLYDIPMDSNGGIDSYGRTGYSDNNQGAEILGSKAIINTLWKRKQNTTSEYWSDLKATLKPVETAPSNRISIYNYLIAP